MRYKFGEREILCENRDEVEKIYKLVENEGYKWGCDRYGKKNLCRYYFSKRIPSKNILFKIWQCSIYKEKYGILRCYCCLCIKA